VKIKVAPGTQTGRRLRLPGKGLPDPKEGKAGDLYAVLRLQAPSLDAEDPAIKAAIELLEAHYGDVRAAFTDVPTA
jgi:DnaJ-class molecular chaperone